MLAELKAEREGVEQAITVLERIASGRGKRRGRPPTWMTGAERERSIRTKQVRSAATRAPMAAAQGQALGEGEASGGGILTQTALHSKATVR